MRVDKTYDAIGPLFGVSAQMVGAIVHSWAVFLDQSLSVWFFLRRPDHKCSERHVPRPICLGLWACIGIPAP